MLHQQQNFFSLDMGKRADPLFKVKEDTKIETVGEEGT
jgi:hypothetical protein